MPTNFWQREYESGRMIGAYVDHPDLPAHVRRIARREHAQTMNELKIPRFERDADTSAIAGSSKGQLCTPYKQYLATDPTKALSGAQSTGDCVSWGTRTASDMTRVWEILVGRQPEEYVKRQATAMIYARRGHTGQGANGSTLSKWHIKDGFLLEQIVKDADGKDWDFSEYRNYVSIGMKHGRTGLPEALLQVTRPHRLKVTTLVAEMDALADAIFNGYCPHVCSSLGVSSKGNPVSRRSGSWAHDMAIVGFDDTEECHRQFGGRIWFWDQSWGDWNTVTNIPEQWKPWGQGMFALSENDTWFAVRQEETWIFSDSEGFPARPYDHLVI